MARSNLFSLFLIPLLAVLTLVVVGFWLVRPFLSRNQVPARPEVLVFTQEGVAFLNSSALGPSPQHLWTLPPDATFSQLQERPSGRVNCYWQGESLFGSDIINDDYFISFDEQGRICCTGFARPDGEDCIDVALETWNERGQHAYILRNNPVHIYLKVNRGYELLKNLPRFGYDEVQSLRFSPGGGSLYVLGTSKLWIVGAQSRRLLKVVSPRHGNQLLASWGDGELHAQLSPDCRSILTMHGQLTLFSTRTGQIVHRFNNSIHEEQIGEGFSEPRFCFADSGQLVIAAQETYPDYESWVYSIKSGALRWHGITPRMEMGTPLDTFFVDTIATPSNHNKLAVLRRWSDGKVACNPGVRLDLDDSGEISPLLFTHDGRWLYYVRKNNLYRLALRQFS